MPLTTTELENQLRNQKNEVDALDLVRKNLKTANELRNHTLTAKAGHDNVLRITKHVATQYAAEKGEQNTLTAKALLKELKLLLGLDYKQMKKLLAKKASREESVIAQAPMLTATPSDALTLEPYPDQTNQNVNVPQPVTFTSEDREVLEEMVRIYAEAFKHVTGNTLNLALSFKNLITENPNGNGYCCTLNFGTHKMQEEFAKGYERFRSELSPEKMKNFPKLVFKSIGKPEPSQADLEALVKPVPPTAK